MKGLGKGFGCRTFLVAVPRQPLLQRRARAWRLLLLRIRLRLRFGRDSPPPPRRHRVGSSASRISRCGGMWGRFWGRRETLDKGKFSNRGSGHAVEVGEEWPRRNPREGEIFKLRQRARRRGRRRGAFLSIYHKIKTYSIAQPSYAPESQPS